MEATVRLCSCWSSIWQLWKPSTSCGVLSSLIPIYPPHTPTLPPWLVFPTWHFFLHGGDLSGMYTHRDRKVHSNSSFLAEQQAYVRSALQNLDPSSILTLAQVTYHCQWVLFGFFLFSGFYLAATIKTSQNPSNHPQASVYGIVNRERVFQCTSKIR